MVLTLGIVVGVQGLVIIAMALRMMGLRADSQDADRARESTEELLHESASQLRKERERAAAQMEVLRQEIFALDVEMARRMVPGAIRDRLVGLLSKAPSDQGGDNGGRVP